MEPAKTATISRTEVTGFYRKATYCYAIPFVLLVMAFIVPFLGMLGILTLVPLGAAGLFFTVRGLTIANKNGEREKKDAGYANLFLGVIIIVLGMLGLAFTYVMVN